MRPAAKIQKLAGAIGGKHRVGLFLNQLAFQELAHLLEKLQAFFLGEIHALVGQVGLNELLHLRLDLCQIVFGEGLLAVEVVVEAGLRGRPDAGMRVGEKIGDGGGQQMRGGMAENLQPFGRRRHDELNGPIRFQLGGEIDQLVARFAASASAARRGPIDLATSSAVVP